MASVDRLALADDYHSAIAGKPSALATTVKLYATTSRTTKKR